MRGHIRYEVCHYNDRSSSLSGPRGSDVANHIPFGTLRLAVDPLNKTLPWLGPLSLRPSCVRELDKGDRIYVRHTMVGSPLRLVLIILISCGTGSAQGQRRGSV